MFYALYKQLQHTPSLPLCSYILIAWHWLLTLEIHFGASVIKGSCPGWLMTDANHRLWPCRSVLLVLASTFIFGFRSHLDHWSSPNSFGKDCQHLAEVLILGVHFYMAPTSL
jgi:hypothetical protein